MQEEIINTFYEYCRSILMNNELVDKEIEKISNPQLRKRITEIFQIAQSDMLILTDFLIEVMNCESESDLEMLLDLNQDINEVIN
jgi:hypothetical protein